MSSWPDLPLLGGTSTLKVSLTHRMIKCQADLRCLYWGGTSDLSTKRTSETWTHLGFGVLLHRGLFYEGPTKEKITKRYLWLKIIHDVTYYVNTCDRYQMKNYVNIQKKPTPHYIPSMSPTTYAVMYPSTSWVLYHGYSYTKSIWPQVCHGSGRLLQQISRDHSTEEQICKRSCLPSLQSHLPLFMSWCHKHPQPLRVIDQPNEAPNYPVPSKGMMN